MERFTVYIMHIFYLYIYNLVFKNDCNTAITYLELGNCIKISLNNRSTQETKRLANAGTPIANFALDEQEL